MTSTPLMIAQRAFNMVGKFVFNEDEHSVPGNGSSAESTAWGRSMKSTVVFDLAFRDFELSLQRDPKSPTALVLYATCTYWNTRFVEGIEESLLKYFPEWGPQFAATASGISKAIAVAGGGVAVLGALRVFLSKKQEETTDAVRDNTDRIVMKNVAFRYGGATLFFLMFTWVLFETTISSLPRFSFSPAPILLTAALTAA